MDARERTADADMLKRQVASIPLLPHRITARTVRSFGQLGPINHTHAVAHWLGAPPQAKASVSAHASLVREQLADVQARSARTQENVMALSRSHERALLAAASEKASLATQLHALQARLPLRLVDVSVCRVGGMGAAHAPAPERTSG